MNSPSPPIRHAGFFTGPDGKIRPIWRVFMYTVASAVAITAVTLLVAIVVEAFLPGAMRAKTTVALMMAHPSMFILLYAATDMALIMLAWLFLAAFDRRSFRALGLWFYPRWGRELLAGVGLGAAALGLGVAISVALRATVFHGATELSLHTVLGLAKIGVLLLFAAASEELLFRGYAFQRLVDSVGALWAVLLTSLFFGVAHLLNPAVTPLSTANTVLAGVVLSVAYLKTRALWLPLGLHWAWNFTMGPILGLPVSGLRVTPSLFQADSAGPQWLAGGAYGPESGVVLSVVSVVLIVWMARTRKIAPSLAMAEVLK